MRILPPLICFLVWSCAGQSASPDPVPVATPRGPLPASSGVILLSSVDFPDAGTVFGGHYAGTQFDVRQTSYSMSDALRSRWGRDARRRGEAVLRGAGLRVHAAGPTTSDARELRGVQYSLSASVTTLQVRSTGVSEPFRVEATADMVFELLDLGTGSAVFGRAIRGAARGIGELDSVIGQSVDDAMMRLVADSSFRFALAEMRPDPDAGAPARVRADALESGLIEIGADELNPAIDSSSTGRVIAGIVTLRTPAAYLGTAFILTRDGLALTSARLVRDTRRMRARFPNGVERQLRVLRTNRSRDVALIQIACVACTTVDWEAPRGVDVYSGVVVVAAPLNDIQPSEVGFGRVGGRWGLASGVTLDLQAFALTGGEPVARTNNGRVFAMATQRGAAGRKTALLLHELLRVLKVRPPDSDDDR